MLIGELAIRSGCSKDTIRYYEKIGLINVGSSKHANGVYKNYSSEILERLQQIHRLKECGFTLPEIRHLLVSVTDQGVCLDLPARVAEKIQKLDEKVALLLEHRESLLQIQRSCVGSCDVKLGMPDCIPSSVKKKRPKSL